MSGWLIPIMLSGGRKVCESHHTLVVQRALHVRGGITHRPVISHSFKMLKLWRPVDVEGRDGSLRTKVEGRVFADTATRCR